MFYTRVMLIEHTEILELLGQVPLFAHLKEERLSHLVGHLKIHLYQPGEVVFNIGDPSEVMYVIWKGQVILMVDPEDDFATLQRGDTFGEEALLFDDPRSYLAVIAEETILLHLSSADYLTIADELPGIEERLEVTIRSRRLSHQVDLPWLQADEYVHVITRRHPAILFGRLIVPLIFGTATVLLSALMTWRWLPGRPYGWIMLGVGLPIFLFWLFWTVIDWRNDYFIVTNKRVVWIEKVALIYDSRQEAPLRTVMSVGMERSRLGTLLGFADVVVTTYVGTIRLRNIAQAESIGGLIESYWGRSKSINRGEEAQMMAEKLGHKLGLPWAVDEETHARLHRAEAQEPDEQPIEPGFLAWLFSDFIRLRYESDGAIVYRKHWFILIKNIWLPLVLMLLGLGALAGHLSGLLTVLPVTTAVIGISLSVFACFLWAVYQYADWRNDIFMVTLDQIIDLDRKPLGKVRRRSAPLENVLSIEYERLGFWGFLFNFGTVYITVGNMRLSFDHVYNPSEVQQDVFYRMGERLDSVRQFEIDSERERVSEWIASYHRTMEAIRQRDQNRPLDD